MNMDHELGSVFNICKTSSGKIHTQDKLSIEERYKIYKRQFQVETVEEVHEVHEEAAADTSVVTPVIKKKVRVATSDQYQTSARMSKKERSDLKKNKNKMSKEM